MENLNEPEYQSQPIHALKIFIVIIKMPFQGIVILYTFTKKKDYYKNLITCNTLVTHFIEVHYHLFQNALQEETV